MLQLGDEIKHMWGTGAIEREKKTDSRCAKERVVTIFTLDMMKKDR